ncbi:hypothetical protein KTO58_09040 [Chitinophaga pendula]|uniref:glycosyltransferase n=1 Tax=Chitinophaga TaxID=79328 RepID=UPI000BB09734|nr:MULTISPECIES: nucleotide disphospho-sugar-binding domain-containing protein [Chitinophaga]ASZ13065.1 hypothetical protein CK934_19930 [Chitinophaga sp. MD30]UCJ09313.1 hypothetical protein KTO58_09040 [Chitinophaga pendula]
MSRILFGCVPFWGHLNPTIAVAQQLIARGHTVAYACHPEMQPALDKAGIPFIADYAFCEVFVHLNKIVATASLLTVRKELKKWNVSLSELPVAGLEEDTRRFMTLIAEWQPDVCVFDAAFLPGLMAAEASQTTYVSSCAFPCSQLPSKDLLPNGYGFPSYQKRPGFGDTLKLIIAGMFAKPINRKLNRVRTVFGLPPAQPMSYVGCMYMIYTTTLFDFKRSDLPAQVYYLGPSFSKEQMGADTPFPWEWLDGRPLVYFTMGTFFNKKKVFDKVIAASKDAPWQIVISVSKNLSLDLWQELPENVLLRNFVPQSALLEKVDLVACAGGVNTTTESLLKGLPLLVLPQARDHFDAAQRVVEAGAGIRIDPAQVSVVNIRKAITRLLDEPGYRQQAGVIARDYLQCDAPLAAACLIEKVAYRKAPLLRPDNVEPTVYRADINRVLQMI